MAKQPYLYVPERTAYTLKFKAEVFSLCQVGFALQMEGLAKAEVRPPFLRPEKEAWRIEPAGDSHAFLFLQIQVIEDPWERESHLSESNKF